MANIKISELNPLLTVQDADVIPIVDNAITKKVTAEILRTYTQGNSVLLTGAQTVAGIKTFTSQLASSVATGTAPFSVASTTKVTNLNADLLDGLSSADFQATLSGTGIVKSTAGTISYLTDNSTNWNTAYNDKINSAAVTGIGTNTLTLTQQDAGTITATWVNGTLIREIRNTTGATLTKGTIVYISGATGNKPTVSKALATGDSTSAQTFGFVQEDILNNANGYVVIIGDLIGVDTSAFTEGDQLYLSSTVAGAFTAVKQYAPNHLVYVGIVTRAHPTLGQIEVNIQNGYELDELHNVAAQSPSNGDILQYVTSTGLWTKIAGTTTNISEGTNLYFTDARARAAISLTTTGTSGAATYNSTTGVLNVPNYADGGITSLNGLTALTQTFAVGTSGTDFGISSATSTHTFNLPTASATNRGALSSADWSTFSAKQNAITLTTTGTSGAATLVGATLNIPNYGTALANYLPLAGGTLTGTLNGTTSIMSGVGLNYGFQGLLSAGTGRWNLYMTGTAANHLQGNLLIGGTGLPLNRKISIEGNITGAATSYGIDQFVTISSDVTTSMFGYRSNPSTAAAAFTLPDLYHFYANDAGIGAGSSVTRQYGFYSSIASGTGKWGVYMAGTADNYMNGNLGLGVTPSAWSGFKALQTVGGSVIGAAGQLDFWQNAYYDGASKYYATGTATRYGMTAGQHRWYNAISGSANAALTWVQAMTLDASGSLSILGGLSLSGALAAASGIQFPATQVASANNNNLDDYEEGTWTMGLTFGGAAVGITYSGNTGNYVKIGKKVTVTGYMLLTNKGTSTGTVSLTGLPFTVATATANYSAASLVLSNITFLGTNGGYSNVNTTTVSLTQTTTAGATSALADTNFANNSSVIISLTYFV